MSLRSLRNRHVLALSVSLALAAAPALAGGGSSGSGNNGGDAARVDLSALRDGVRYDRFIVRYQDAQRLRTTAQQRTRTLQTALGRAGLSANVQHLRRTATGGDVVAVSRGLDRVDAARLLHAFAADPAVAHVEPDVMLRHTGKERVLVRPAKAQRRATQVTPAANPDDEYYAEYQWHLHDVVGGIKAPSAWDSATGEGVVVAVLDTGITAHSDLDANLLEGYDFISDAFVSRRDSDARAPGAADLGDWNDDPSQCPVSPSSWHGTHVTGTVAELTNNGIGMAGVAHDAKVLPVRVLGRCGGYLSDIADAVVWASGGAVDGVPANANPAEVINMSLSGGGSCAATSEMQIAIDAAIANGTTVVVAAGNDNANSGNFTPASCAGVITVGATRINGGRTGYSNYGATVELAAPGGGGMIDGNPGGYVWQSWHDSETVPVDGAETYVGYTGTSMAAPHVAGVAALVQSVAETPLTPAEMSQLLIESARAFPVTIPSGTPLGAGILDADAAVAALKPPCQGEDCEPDAAPIVNAVPVRNLSGITGGSLLFALEVPKGATGLNFLSYGGSGDVTLLVSRGEEPTVEKAQFRSARPGNNETIRVAKPQAGTWYVKLVGVARFQNVTLQARHN
jgi:serine protease